MAYAFHVKRPEAYIHPTCAPMMPAAHRAASIKTLKSLPDDAPSILKDAAVQALGALQEEVLQQHCGVVESVASLDAAPELEDGFENIEYPELLPRADWFRRG